MNVKLTDVLRRIMAIHGVTVKEYFLPMDNTAVSDVDEGFRSRFYQSYDWEAAMKRFSSMITEDEMYVLCDPFNVHYVVFIPSKSPESVIIAGPYRLSGSGFDVDKLAEKGFSLDDIELVRRHILSIPHVHEDAIMLHLRAVLSAAVEKEEIEVKTIKENVDKGKIKNRFAFVEAYEKEMFSPDNVEKRYKIENELLEAVSQGNLTKVKRIAKKFPIKDIDGRFASVHAQKNSLIIMNTLLRKAVEKAHVHPFYLDEISFRFFQKIDYVTDRASQMKLIEEMLMDYCEYSRKYSVEKYSPLVQKALLYIQLNFTNKISLSDVAKECRVSDSHLARQFRIETGKSVVDFVNHSRIVQAANILVETDLSVSEVAAAVGILDTNYFSRLFKKYMGHSPSEHRG